MLFTASLKVNRPDRQPTPDRRRKYLAGRRAQSTAGRTVIVVDDGIATGTTVRVTLRALRLAGAARAILAVPVAPKNTLDTLQAEVDEIVRVNTPEPFLAVGQHYADFEQISDEEVVKLMDEASKLVVAELVGDYGR